MSITKYYYNEYNEITWSALKHDVLYKCGLEVISYVHAFIFTWHLKKIDNMLIDPFWQVEISSISATIPIKQIDNTWIKDFNFKCE